MEFNKLALVTGGSRGIGRAICQRFLDDGYQVAFFAKDEGRARAFMKEREGEALFFYRCDVSSPREIEDAAKAVLTDHGTVSVLVNNAGIQTHCSFLDMTPEIWNQTMNIDLNSLFYVSRAFLPAMIEQGYGRIINMSSMSALRGSNRHVHYNTAKAGVLGFTRGLSYEAAQFGVTVNAICPGTVDTEIIHEYIEEKREQWLSQMHVKRLGLPEDIANAAAFLASEDSGWITGQAIHVNGGIMTP